MRRLLHVVAFVLLGAVAVDGQQDNEARRNWPLIYAAGEGDVETVTQLLKAGVDIGQRSKDGESALHVAAIRGNLPTTRALLAAGADPNARTPRGSTLFMTPTMWAVYHGHKEFVQLLLDAGADPRAADENGKTLLTMSQEARQPEIEVMLQKKIESLVDSEGDGQQ